MLDLPGLRACGSEKGTPEIRTCPSQSVCEINLLCSLVTMYVRGRPVLSSHDISQPLAWA